MAKTFMTVGEGSAQTLSEIESDKIPVYSTEADLDTDLANLADGELALYPSEGAEMSLPVDEVESGNLHAVTSNAVSESITATENFCMKTWENVIQVDLSAYFNKISRSGYSGVVLYCACYDTNAVGFYLVNCCISGGVYTHLLGGSNNRSFSFDPSTYILTWTALGSQQATNHFTLLG